MLAKGLFLASLALPLSGNAAPITSNTGLTGTTVIDFSQFVDTNQYEGVTGPIQIGDAIGSDIVVSAASATIYLYDDSWGLADNGDWTTGGRTGFLAIWPGDGPIRIDFNDGPVTVAGFYMNYCPPSYPISTISAFNSGGQLLETFDVAGTAPISTPGGSDVGEFRGIQRDVAEIAYLELFGQCSVYDDMEFSIQAQGETVPVPVNAMWMLVLLSLVLVLTAGYGLRRRKIS